METATAAAWHALRIRNLSRDVAAVKDTLAGIRAELGTETATREPQSALQREALMCVAQAMGDLGWTDGDLDRAAAMLEKLAELGEAA